MSNLLSTLRSCGIGIRVSSNGERPLISDRFVVKTSDHGRNCVQPIRVLRLGVSFCALAGLFQPCIASGRVHAAQFQERALHALELRFHLVDPVGEEQIEGDRDKLLGFADSLEQDTPYKRGIYLAATVVRAKTPRAIEAQFRESIAKLHEVTPNSVEYSKARLEEANLDFQLNEYDAESQALTEALQKDPNYLPAERTLFNLQLKLNNYLVARLSKETLRAKAERISGGKGEAYARSLGLIAGTYKEIGYYPQAHEFFFMAHKALLDTKGKTTVPLAENELEIASLYFRFLDRPRCLAWIETALDRVKNSKELNADYACDNLKLLKAQCFVSDQESRNIPDGIKLASEVADDCSEKSSVRIRSMYSQANIILSRSALLAQDMKLAVKYSGLALDADGFPYMSPSAQMTPLSLSCLLNSAHSNALAGDYDSADVAIVRASDYVRSLKHPNEHLSELLRIEQIFVRDFRSHASSEKVSSDLESEAIRLSKLDGFALESSKAFESILDLPSLSSLRRKSVEMELGTEVDNERRKWRSIFGNELPNPG